MDYWSYLPFLQFIRDDKETVTIMAEAMQIVPTVCKILQVPRSHGRTASQTSAGNVGASSSPSSPGIGQDHQLPSTSSSTSSAAISLQDFAAASSLMTLSRKRKRPEETNPPAIMYPLKKRRLTGLGEAPAGDTSRDCNLPNTSGATTVARDDENGSTSNTNAAETSSNSVPSGLTGNVDGGDQLALIRLKLKQDYDTFVDQVGQLASLERQKNTLIQKFVQLCTAASLESAPTTGTSETGTAATDSTTNNPTPAPTNSGAGTEAVSDRNVDNDHSYASPSPPSA